MKIIKVLLLLAAFLLLATGITVSWFLYHEFSKMESDDPQVWTEDIWDFKEKEVSEVLPESPILFVGSSSIRFWNSLEEDMHPYPIIRRGFGGAKLTDIIYYAGQIIIPYQPKAVVLFAGTNDISGRPNDKSPQELFKDFKTLVQLLEKEIPGTPLYYISITPTTARWDVWPQVQEANQLIKTYAEEKQWVTFIDTTAYFMDEEGKPDSELLWWDGVHLSRYGYQVWATVIKDKLREDLFSGM